MDRMFCFWLSSLAGIAGLVASHQGPGPAVLLLSDPRGGFAFQAKVDATFKAKLRQAGKGYQWDAANYRDVTPERLQQYNVVVMTYPPTGGDVPGREQFAAAFPLLRSFLESGGGLLVFADECYDSYQVLNEFLAPLGAQLLPENIVDEPMLYRQPRYLQEYFGRTTNLVPHAVTEGVRELWYPLAWSPRMSGATLALQVDENWQVVGRGNATAHSYRWKAHEEGQKTYDSAPPFIAVRTVGSGRMALFATRSLNYLHQGYHRIFEGLCLDRGEGLRFLTNLCDWLAEPSLQAEAPGGFTEPPETPSPPPAFSPEKLAEMDLYTRLVATGSRTPVTAIRHQPSATRDFVGLLGVYTSRSKGYGNVADFCQRARSLGYHFLGFTDCFADLNEGKWQELVTECRAASDEEFVAIPGIEIEDLWGNTFFSFDLPRWVSPEWLAQGQPRLENWAGYYFGLSHSSQVFLGHYLATPRAGFTPPWFAKFYAGLELFSYNHGHLFLGDAFEEYRQCQANDYNLIPIAGHRLYAPSELEQVRGYKTHVRARQVADVPQAFRYGWYTPRSVYVSSGPRLVEWAIENGRGGMREEEWRLYLEVESDAPLAEVTLYDRSTVFRRFRPDGKRFRAEVGGYHDRQRFFLLVAEDAAGGRAVSSALYTSDLRQSIYMCTDLQNTLNCMTAFDQQGKMTVMGVLGNYVTGWDSLNPPLLVSSAEVLPESGIEYGFGGWQGTAGHRLYGADRTEYAVAQRDMVFACGDCNILDNLYETTLWPAKGGFPAPTDGATSRARFIAFTPRPYSPNLLLVEQEITFRRAVTLAQRDGPEVLGLALNFQTNSFPFYCFAGRAKEKGERGGKTQLVGEIPPGGYAAVFPDFWGSGAIFPLDRPVQALLNDGNLELGWDRPAATVPAGTKLRQRWLVVRGKFGESDEAEFDRIRQAYGLAGPPPYRVAMQQGAVADTRFALTLQAQNRTAIGEITLAPLPNDLPVVVRGLCDHWDAGWLDRTTGALRRVGVFGDATYTTVPIDHQPAHFAVGNLLTCDHPEVFLSLFHRGQRWTVEIHNPRPQPVRLTVRTAPWLAAVVSAWQWNGTVGAGGTVKKEFQP